MRTTDNNNVASFTITDTSVEDPITVFMRVFGEQSGELTIICWGRAWSCYWSRMGMNLGNFICKASAEYIANKMLQHEIITNKKTLERDRKYLETIIGDVKQAVMARMQSESA